MTGTELLTAYPIRDHDLTGLHHRLTASAQADGLLDVAYRTVDSPVGTLLLAATPIGLVRLAFAAEGIDTVLQDLADQISPRVLHAPAALDADAIQLDEYFTGRRHRFELDLDWRLSSGFRNRVLRHLAIDVGYGDTASYRSLASLAGNPTAVRAVGTACATNPIPVVVPCHRVIRSDGTMGGYRGGPAAKRVLLDLEKKS
jgi:methylated-DNA-[protein]-cysteine S-methyltransferase